MVLPTPSARHHNIACHPNSGWPRGYLIEAQGVSKGFLEGLGILEGHKGPLWAQMVSLGFQRSPFGPSRSSSGRPRVFLGPSGLPWGLREPKDPLGVPIKLLQAYRILENTYRKHLVSQGLPPYHLPHASRAQDRGLWGECVVACVCSRAALGVGRPLFQTCF
jgi:hypothetical protein